MFRCCIVQMYVFFFSEKKKEKKKKIIVIEKCVDKMDISSLLTSSFVDRFFRNQMSFRANNRWWRHDIK